MHVVINKRHVVINHVMPIAKVGAVFPKAGVQAVVITSKGRAAFDLSDGGEFCRIHQSHQSQRIDGDAFVYIDGEWIRVDLNTVDFVSRKKW